MSSGQCNEKMKGDDAFLLQDNIQKMNVKYKILIILYYIYYIYIYVLVAN